MSTLHDRWLAYANRHLPADVSQTQVMRARRAWYGVQLDRLAAMPSRSAADEALFQEALGFGRAVGTAAEAAA